MRWGWLLTALMLAAPVRAADRDTSRAAMHEGIKQLYAGHPKAARSQLFRAVKAGGDWALPYAVQGRVLLALGDGAGAQSALERAVANGMKQEQLSHLFAHAYLLQGNADRAMAEARTAPPSREAQAYAGRVRAGAALAMGDMVRAGAELDAAITLTPKSSLLWTDVGRFRMKNGNIAGAVAATQIAVTNNPNNVDALMQMGELTRGQYGLMAAIPWFARILVIDPDNLGAMQAMAATLGDAGRNVEMLAMTRKILEADPGNAQAYFLQAVLAARANKIDLARSLIYRINGKMDTVPAMMLLSAVLDLKEGNSESAITTLRNLVKAQPINLKARRLLGTAMWHSGDAKSAISILQPIANRADADSYTLSVIGRAYEEDGNRGAAATYLDRASMPVRGEPVPFELQGNLIDLAKRNADDADVVIPRISNLIASGNGVEALTMSEALRNKNPGVPAAHVLVGDSLLALNRPADAALAYQKAANIQFSESTALRLVAALQKSNQDGAALRVLDLFLGQNPRSVPGLLLASDHFMATGQWDRAIAILDGLRLRLGNRDATLLSNLAWAWFSKGNAEQAVTFARAAYSVAPANPAVVNSSGWILYKTGKDKVAGVALLQKAVGIAPNHPNLRYQLAQALIGTGQREAARIHLQKASATADFTDRKAASAMLAGL
jgi:cellulose synthase operon protein C